MKIRKKLIWAVNFTVLALFSLYSLAGTFGLGSSQAYAQALKKDDFYKQQKNMGKRFMVVDRGNGNNPNESEEICALDNEQVAELDAFFSVQTFELDVEGEESVTLAAVHGRQLNKNELMNYLQASDAELDCRIVQVRRVFFLPVLPQIS